MGVKLTQIEKIASVINTFKNEGPQKGLQAYQTMFSTKVDKPIAVSPQPEIKAVKTFGKEGTEYSVNANKGNQSDYYSGTGDLMVTTEKTGRDTVLIGEMPKQTAENMVKKGIESAKVEPQKDPKLANVAAEEKALDNVSSPASA